MKSAMSGAPLKIKRAPGLDPKIGRADVNTKKVIMGGTEVRASTDTDTMPDPDITGGGSDSQYS